MKSKKGQATAQIKTLKTMWEKSNTEEKILQEIRQIYGENIYKILKRGSFVLIGDLWVVLLSRYDYEELISTPGVKFFFELESGNVKPWTGDLSSLVKTRRGIKCT